MLRQHSLLVIDDREFVFQVGFKEVTVPGDMARLQVRAGVDKALENSNAPSVEGSVVSA